MNESPRAVTANIVTRVINRTLNTGGKAGKRRKASEPAPKELELVERAVLKDQVLVALEQWRANTFGFDKLTAMEVISGVKKLLHKL